ncbi:hypothetical protein HNR46_002808 [Haloferula luteola]|uniref:Uncharacterized protein n=1 Tax=Haloferula luteola TaxID=595692 RepID=A0A840V3K3_9BACT|nr:hypothetical protein [Haloferula luteola]MBB5352562.1 hypothetical protein [Haloferula luteola]
MDAHQSLHYFENAPAHLWSRDPSRTYSDKHWTAVVDLDDPR